jgi:kynurenine 3-monooxygenase
MTTQPLLNIAGAGLAGSLLAVYMARRGYGVHVYERRPDMRLTGADEGRSINLALSARGLRALQETGLREAVLQDAIPMYGRMVHNLAGEQQFQPYSRDQQDCIYAISRGDLNRRLMDAAEHTYGVQFHFGYASEAITPDTHRLIVRDLSSDTRIEAPGAVTLACDGAYSAIRGYMQRTPRFDYSQSYIRHGYKELTIPPGPDGDYRMASHALHIWPRDTYMLIALPNPDRSFTCTLFFPFEGPVSFEALDTPARAKAFFEAQFADALAMMPDFETEFTRNPTGSLVTVRCFPWTLGDSVALVGDAAHAIVPFFGQGMNAAFEDCTALNRLLDVWQDDWTQVLPAYQAERKPQADAIAEMALDNFIEMRDKVNDPAFVFQKKVEHILGSHFPAYRSRYEMVSFSCIPYAEALARGQVNTRILTELIQDLTDPSQVDLSRAADLIRTHLAS